MTVALAYTSPGSSVVMDPPPCSGLRTKMSSVAAASVAQRAVPIVRTTEGMAQIGMDRVEVLIACALADSTAGCLVKRQPNFQGVFDNFAQSTLG